MIAIGDDEVAKYPFLVDAGKRLKDKGFDLEQFGTDPDLRPLMCKAYERIQVAADGGIYKSEPINANTMSEGIVFKEIISFPLAIVILKLCGIRTMFNRFALAEARRAEQYLEKDLKDVSNPQKSQLARRIIYDLFGIYVEQNEEDDFLIPVVDYLKYSVDFYEREWELVNRRVYDGLVHLTSHEIVRLLRTELGVYIKSKITSIRTPQMVSGFEEYTSKVTELAKKFETPIVLSGEYPPCIKHAIDVLERGENLPHSGRFMLASYLLSRGQAIEDVAPLFKNAPDYNERITMFQLNHIAGDGNDTKYSCPSCDNLRMKDLCFATSECEGIRHPMQFGTRKTK